MNTNRSLLICIVSSMLLAAGCVGPIESGYSGYPYDTRTYDPYYRSARTPYYDYDSYYDSDRRSHRELHRDLKGDYRKLDKKLDYKHDKAMRRLDRQEREAEEKLYRKYDGNTSDPRYQEKLHKIDKKYDHKRGKVERNVNKDYREGVQDLRREHDRYHRW